MHLLRAYDAVFFDTGHARRASCRTIDTMARCYLLCRSPHSPQQRGLAGHVWVMSLGADGNVVFWESLTGERSVPAPWFLWVPAANRGELPRQTKHASLVWPVLVVGGFYFILLFGFYRWVHSRWDKSLSVDRNVYSFKTIDCIFNYRSFYANVQASDKLTECSMDIGNEVCYILSVILRKY